MGCYLYPVYGLTETTSPALMVPLGTRAPLDPAGAFVSVGLPVTATSVHVVDDDLARLPQGQTGGTGDQRPSGRARWAYARSGESAR